MKRVKEKMREREKTRREEKEERQKEEDKRCVGEKTKKEVGRRRWRDGEGERVCGPSVRSLIKFLSATARKHCARMRDCFFWLRQHTSARLVHRRDCLF